MQQVRAGQACRSGGRAVIDYPSDYEYGLVAYCPYCNTRHHPVRPGKTQPACDCDDVCGVCGMEHEFADDNPKWPCHHFKGCPECGPFAPTKGEVIANPALKEWKEVDCD